MARFSKSNRIAQAQMAYVDQRKKRRSMPQVTEQSYFRRIGFDHAMI